MKRRSWQLDRRTVLRGAGGAIALPFLEAMIPPGRRVAQAAQPLLFLGVYYPNGVSEAQWHPPGGTGALTLSSSLSPLEPVKDYVTVLTNMRHPDSGGSTGGHYSGTAHFLTNAKADGGGKQGIYGLKMDSFDQLIAKKYAGQTKMPSLHVGYGWDPVQRPAGQRYTLSYIQGQYVPVTLSAQKVFDDLYGVPAPMRTQLDRKPVLDFVVERTNSLLRRVGKADVERLDQYFTGLRELDPAGKLVPTMPAGGSCVAGINAAEDALKISERIRLRNNLIIKAFECDITRVATLMWGFSVNDLRYPEATGLPSGFGHHNWLSHWDKQDFGGQEGDRDASRAAWPKLDKWFVGHFTHILEELKKRPTPTGNLLDSAVVYLASDVNGSPHATDGMTVLLAGKAGGMLKGNRSVKLPRDGGPTFGDMFIKLGQFYGMQLSSFGTWGKKPMSEI